MNAAQVNVFSVEEIDATELCKVQGGWAWLIPAALGVGAAVGTQLLADWDDLKAGLSGGCPKP